MKNLKSTSIFAMAFSLFLIGTSSIFAQPKNMKLIPGGTYIMGNSGYQYEIKGPYMHLIGNDTHYDELNQKGTLIGEVPEYNNTPRQVTIYDFYLSDMEVTNLDYRMFLIDSVLDPEEVEAYYKAMKRAGKEPDVYEEWWRRVVDRSLEAGLYPDTACWINDFPYSYNQPLAQNYFSHPAFDEYPVVGVSWDQAKIFCTWLSKELNEARAKKGLPALPNYRLPTEAEFEYAAIGLKPSTDGKPVYALYPWKGTRIWNEKAQYRANLKTDHGDYIDDGQMYTAPVGSYAPNGFRAVRHGRECGRMDPGCFPHRNRWGSTFTAWRKCLPLPRRGRYGTG